VDAIVEERFGFERITRLQTRRGVSATPHVEWAGWKEPQGFAGRGPFVPQGKPELHRVCAVCRCADILDSHDSVLGDFYG
jgi:hypothetical protein